MEKLYSEKYTKIKEINDSIENETIVRVDEQLNEIEVKRESDKTYSLSFMYAALYWFKINFWYFFFLVQTNVLYINNIVFFCKFEFGMNFLVTFFTHQQITINTLIKEINDSIENETIVRVDEQLNEIEVKRESDNRHFMKIKSEIQQKEKILTAAFRSYFLELLAKLEENRKDHERPFNIREGELKSLISFIFVYFSE
jgi:type II secretory pathway component GspD/PulD (secretin)